LKKLLIRVPDKTFKWMKEVRRKHGIPYQQQVIRAINLYLDEFLELGEEKKEAGGNA